MWLTCPPASKLADDPTLDSIESKWLACLADFRLADNNPLLVARK